MPEISLSNSRPAWEWPLKPDRQPASETDLPGLAPDAPDYDVGADLPEPGWFIPYVRSSSGATAEQIADMKLRLCEKSIARRTGRQFPQDWPASDALDSGDAEC